MLSSLIFRMVSEYARWLRTPQDPPTESWGQVAQRLGPIYFADDDPIPLALSMSFKEGMVRLLCRAR